MEQAEKWQRTMRAYHEYEGRFAAASAARPFYFPTQKADRERIVQRVKRMVGYDEALLPHIGEMQTLHRTECCGYDVLQLKYTTWENFYAAGSLYLPHGEQRVPLVFVFCGHGAGGRLTPSYAAMAHRLASMGMAVMVPDNIGQGDRSAYGHRNVIAPFYCGMSLQGMILMESVALIRHMMTHPRVDKTRLGACGNSGGGTLCLFLAALAPELSALSSSGYPSDFSYIHAKERRHCACNLLPGSAHGPEMWEILSAFAPKPLLLEEGRNDDLMPFDLFMRTARKVGQVYRMLDAEERLEAVTTDTGHTWMEEDIRLISDFLGRSLCQGEMLTAPPSREEILTLLDGQQVSLPEDGLTTDALAERLTGIKMPKGTMLSDIFVPTLDGRPLRAEELVPDVGRGDVMRVLAQMECALTEKG